MRLPLSFSPDVVPRVLHGWPVSVATEGTVQYGSYYAEITLRGADVVRGCITGCGWDLRFDVVW